MTLLFVAMKAHGQHAFIPLWAKAFGSRGYRVELIVQEGPPEPLNDGPVRIHSLGKERGLSKPRQALRFLRRIVELDYDRVFIYGTPIWGMLGLPRWLPKRVPTYLWYTHYTMHPSLWVTTRYAKRLFCATSQSLPQFNGSPKKVITGHGIDLDFWVRRPNVTEDPHRLLCVHRLSRSKRVELLLRALAILPEAYTLDVYGDELDPQYLSDLRALAAQLGLGGRVAFHASAPVTQLSDIYARHRLILNMASETIDKTMLEAMTCGCYPVVTRRNAEAIGIPAAPEEDPQSIATFVERHARRPPLSDDEMYEIVVGRHSLDGVVERLDAYIAAGT